MVMSRWRARLLRHGGALVAGLASLSMAAPAFAGNRAPYVPASADVVLQHVPSVADPRVRKLDALRAQFEKQPSDMHGAVTLSRAYLDYGRSTGDARYLGRALAVIEPWLNKNPIPIPVLLVHATILQSRHAFQSARGELQSLLQRDPGNAQAWLTLATVAMVQGDYTLANHACVQLAENGGNFLGTLCAAQLRALDGHARQAYALLSLIEQSGREVPVDFKSYVESLMAETAARLGDAKGADAHYQTALQLTPGDNFLLADYGDFLLDQNRPREVIALVKDYRESDTSFLRQVLAEATLGDKSANADIAELAARFHDMDLRGSRLYRREEAIFTLHLQHDPARALTMAQENWSVQREPKDMRILLEAALAAKKPQAAQPVMAFVANSHLDDPPIEALTARVNALLATAPSDSSLKNATTKARP